MINDKILKKRYNCHFFTFNEGSNRLMLGNLRVREKAVRKIVED